MNDNDHKWIKLAFKSMYLGNSPGFRSAWASQADLGDQHYSNSQSWSPKMPGGPDIDHLRQSKTLDGWSNYLLYSYYSIFWMIKFMLGKEIIIWLQDFNDHLIISCLHRDFIQRHCNIYCRQARNPTHTSNDLNKKAFYTLSDI